MSERISVWRCIGCGRIEGPRPCIGVCEDRKDSVVFASDHEREVGQLRGQIQNLAAVLQQIAYTTPRDGQCERTWLALQTRARSLLNALANDEAAGPT